MTAALLFPGQGAQQPGMLTELPATPEVERTLEEASDTLGCDARALDRADALRATVPAQLALLIAGVAAARALSAAGATPDVVVGHSVGAFGAAVAADALAFPDALRAVRLRGDLMAQAYPAGFGLAVLVGLTEGQVERLVSEAGSAGPLFLANRNAPLQTVVAGSAAALDALCALGLRCGARKAERLAVAVPSHCPMMAPIARALAAALADVPFAPPQCAFASSSRARLLTTPEQIRDDLAANAARPVLWHDTTLLLRELGVGLFVQCPPGTVLSDLTQDAFACARSVAIAVSGLNAAAYLIRRDNGGAG
jgi:malonate decarboxylase epsilon subunit